MGKELGYIKISRNILNNEFLMGDKNARDMFILILLSADYKTATLKTGRNKLAKICNLKPTTAYKTLLRLERENMVELNSDKSRTEIFITNWDRWQKDGDSSVSTRYQPSDNLGDNLGDINPIRKTDESDKSGNSAGILGDQIGDTIQEGRKKKISNTSPFPGVHVDNLSTRTALIELMKIVNSREKPNDTRERMLKARLKDYSIHEIKDAAVELSRSKWHRENRQMSIDNLLVPSKIGRWFQASLESKKQFSIPGSSSKKSTPQIEDKPLTEEQKLRGKLVKKLIEKKVPILSIGRKSVKELQTLLDSYK